MTTGPHVVVVPTFGGEPRRKVGGRPSLRDGILGPESSYAIMFRRGFACCGCLVLPRPTFWKLSLYSSGVWRLLLFRLPPFLLLLFLRRRFHFRLLALSRRRRLSRYRRRSALLLALGPRKRLRSRSGLVPVWLGLTAYWTSGFGTVIRGWHRRAVIARRWLSRTIRLGTSHVGTIVRLIRLVIRWRCGRTTRRRAFVRLIRIGTIVRLWRCRLIRLGGG